MSAGRDTAPRAAASSGEPSQRRGPPGQLPRSWHLWNLRRSYFGPYFSTQSTRARAVAIGFSAPPTRRGTATRLSGSGPRKPEGGEIHGFLGRARPRAPSRGQCKSAPGLGDTVYLRRRGRLFFETNIAWDKSPRSTRRRPKGATPSRKMTTEVKKRAVTRKKTKPARKTKGMA